MKIAWDDGHNCIPDVGATGIIQEDVGNRQVGLRAQQILREMGHTVIDVTPYNQKFNSVVGSLGYRCRLANEAKVDLYVALHMNAANGIGHGTEVYSKDANDVVAKHIVESISSLGFTNRGVKFEQLYVLNYTSAHAILVEMCFCDSSVDMGIFNIEKMAQALVKGILGQASAIQAPSPVVKPAIVSYSALIAKVQKALNIFTLRDNSNRVLVEDGYQGPRTASAIVQFQKLMGIPQTALADTLTVKAIDEILSRPLDGVWCPHLEYATRFIQFKLGIPVTGYFEAKTAKAVINWQALKGLQADGVVGPNSWKALLN